MSQGGHRALLRLAMDPGIEIERSRLGPDPLRGVVQPDSDAEDKSLGLQVVQRSFADRLILETAIQHRNSVNPDHDVILLTSDQGLARMALAEGLQPMFCDANAVNDVFGSTRTGVVFAPFLREGTRLSHISLADILWESATSFGSARLISQQSKDTFTVSALQSTVPWQLHHSIEDLLWTETHTPPHPSVTSTTPLSEPSPPLDPTTVAVEPLHKTPGSSAGSIAPAKKASATQIGRPVKSRKRQGSYSFKLASMVDLIQILEHRDLSDDEAMSTIKVKSKSTYGEYYNFLAAGTFARRVQKTLSRAPALTTLLDSMRSLDYVAIAKALKQVPSFYTFVHRLHHREGLNQAAAGLRKDAFRTYAALAELACVGVSIRGQGVYGTPSNPTPAQFVEPAISAFDAVRQGERFALSGAWLEYLVANDGIHPVHVRQRLAEAHQAGYLQRYFEGSTPETRFQTRSIACLHVAASTIGVRMANLYFGDFSLSGQGFSQHSTFIWSGHMSLVDRMNKPPPSGGASSLYGMYGIGTNPFPAAGRPSGHPRLENSLDDEVESRFREFETPTRPSQVVLVEGTQGVGKTNLLNYYEDQFRRYYDQDESFYIIRYYPDPEPSFDAIVRRIFQSLDQQHFEKLAEALARAPDSERDAAKEVARSLDVRIVLNGLERLARWGGDLDEGARLALEWFGGLRVLKRHREVLGVNYRLDHRRGPYTGPPGRNICERTTWPTKRNASSPRRTREAGLLHEQDPGFCDSSPPYAPLSMHSLGACF